MPVKFNTVEELIYALINEIGLSIYNDELYDQENYTKINMEGKSIKCSIDTSHPVYGSEYSIVLDPINNMNLMTLLMSYYFGKEEASGNFTVLSYNFNDNGLSGPHNQSSIRVKMVGNNIVESRYYYNRCLKFSDIILRLGGYNPDLSNFDQIMEIR